MSIELYHHFANSALHLMQQLPPAPPVHRVRPNGSGCVDSPEAATSILMMVGTLGATYGSSLVMRVMRKRQGVKA